MTTLREQMFRDQKVLMDRHNLLVTVRSYMNGRGIDKKVLRAMDKEVAHLGLLIEGYGWASCCIPSSPSDGK